MQEQENQHLDSIIRSSFEKRSSGAPDSLWGKLSSALDADAAAPVEKSLLVDPLDKKIKESFSSQKVKAPSHVWPAINRQLNLNRVWQGISHELDKTRPFYQTSRRMAAAVLLLLLSGVGTSVYFWDSNFAHKPSEASATAKIQAVEQEQALANSVQAQGGVEATAKAVKSAPGHALLNQEEIIGLKERGTAALTSAEPASATMTALDLSAGQMQTSIIPFDVVSLPFYFEGIQQQVQARIEAVDTVVSPETAIIGQAEEKKRRPFSLNNFSAGPVMAYNNSWLLNNETKSSYDKNSLIATDPTYKQNWGLALNYQISSKSIVATEFYMIGKAGQQYKMYQDGEYLRKGLELQYNKLYVQYQRNFLSYGKNNPSCLTVKAGAYGGYLHDKLGELRPEESRYAKFDYGVKLAIGQEHSLGRLIIGYGVGAERGLKNVFRGTERLPAEFDKTYILNVGTYLNMRYSF